METTKDKHTKVDHTRMPASGVLRKNRRNVKNRIIMELLFIKYFDAQKLHRPLSLRWRP